MSRLKESGTPNPNNFDSGMVERLTDFTYHYFYGGVSVSNNPIRSRVTEYYREKFAGMVLPNFHLRKNKGELLPYTYYSKVSSRYDAWGDWRVDVDEPSSYGYAEPVGKFPYIHVPEAYSPGFEENLPQMFMQDQGIDPRMQIQKAAASLRTQAFDVLTFAAEFHKTVRQLTGALRDFTNLLYEFGRQGNPEQLFLQEWLATRYGWRITVYDIQDILISIFRLNEMIERARVKTRAGEEWSDVETFYTVSQGTSVGVIQVDFTKTVTMNIRASIIADYKKPVIIVDPLTTAWELVPYSFVIDWFYNIGRALNAFAFASLSGNYTSCYGIKYVETAVVDNPTVVSENAGKHISFDQGSVCTTEVLLRAPSSVPYFPSISMNLNVYKVVDLLALLTTAVGSLKKRGIRI